MAEDPPARQRLDLVLWHARVVRTRPDAAALVRSGHVRVDGAKVKTPSQMIRPGQVLTVALSHGVRLLRVLGFSERRGDAAAAAVLVAEIAEDDGQG